jgi:hypothetical protein
MVPDLARPIEPPLKVRPRSNEDAIAEFKSVEVFEPNLTAYRDTISAMPRGGTKNRSPHQERKRILADGKSLIQV